MPHLPALMSRLRTALRCSGMAHGAGHGRGAGVGVGVGVGVGALAMLALLFSLAAWPARADDGDEPDHERARRAVQAGEVLPLQTLLRQLGPAYRGQVLEVELEIEHGRWIYEIRLLQPDGRLLKLEVDARTGAVLKARQRGRPRGGDHLD